MLCALEQSQANAQLPINRKEATMSTMAIVMTLIDVHSSKFAHFFKSSKALSLFSPPESPQGKLQTYSMLAMFFRKEGNLASSDRFLL